MKTIEPILHSFNYCLDYLHEQVADLDSTDLVAQPNGITNHPAWVIGHITYVSQLLGGVIGLAEWLPGNWSERFGTGSMPVADSALYETKDEALVILWDARSRITEAVRQLNDAHLDEAFPDKSYREIFPTIRHFLTQVLVGHTANHVGQVSVWRRAMGMPRMARAFE